MEKEIRINCFGRLEIYVGNTEQSINMNSAKARELIAYLVTYKGAAVSEANVCEALWEDIPLEYSKDCLYKLVKKIRNMPIPFHLESNRGMLRLNMDNIESDIVLFDELLAQKESIDKWEKVIDLYVGALFEEESYSWANMKAGMYDKKYIDAICLLKEYYEQINVNAKTAYYNKLIVEYA